MEIIMLIKMCLHYANSKACVGINLSPFPVQDDLKQGDVLSSLVLKPGLKYSISKTQEN
jgi:hypothetical protein